MFEKIIFKARVMEKTYSITSKMDFYKIQNLENLKSYHIKIDQLDGITDSVINKEFEFLSWVEDDREFLSIINPKYDIDSEYDFEIDSVYFENEQKFFVLKSNYTRPLKVKALIFQNEEKAVLKCKIIDYFNGRPILENVDYNQCPWQNDSLYDFEINNFEKDDLGNNYVYVNIGNGLKASIKCFWHNSESWKYENIKCLVRGYRKNGLPMLSIEDDRHPIYKIGEVYDFTVVNFIEKKNEGGQKFKVINLTDKFHSKLDVFAFPNQINKIKPGELIQCTVTQINSKIRLKQSSQVDPFFYRFHEIESNNDLEKKFFTSILEIENEGCRKLNEQYTKGSGFWVITYVNQIIPNQLYHLKRRKDLINASQLIKLALNFNSWILTSGFLGAVKEDVKRKAIKGKIKINIENYKVELTILDSILENNSNIIYELYKSSNDFKLLSRFIPYLELEELEYTELWSITTKNKLFTEIDKYYIQSIISTIIYKLGDVNKLIEKKSFIFNKDELNLQNVKLNHHIRWLVLCAEFSNVISSYQRRNLYISKALRLYSINVAENVIQKQILEFAYKILVSLENSIANPFFLKEQFVELNYEIINLSSINSSFPKLNEPYYAVEIKSKFFNGFQINLEQYQGYLPYEMLKDHRLKSYKLNVINWLVNLKINFKCEIFGIFLSEQIDKGNENFLSQNLLTKQTSVNDFVECIVKNVHNELGIFVSTIYGDGLIHISEISNTQIKIEELLILFEKNLKFYAKVINIQENGNLNLSFKALIGTEYEHIYYEIIFGQKEELEQLIENNLPGGFIEHEEEKGYLFDRVSMLALNIEDKIKYMHFAKYFYSVTSNARSYLSNIYLKYFSLITKLDLILEDYSFERYELFKKEIIHLKNEVELKTIENFPESKNLIFFIDVLFLFNSKDDEDLDQLYQTIKLYANTTENILIPAAKSVLANNLMLSEFNQDNTNELNQFTLKNLKRIREFISKGILYISETPENLYEIEIEKQRTYWRTKIAHDEGENLEFKATFKTPVSNKNKEITIQNLRMQMEKSKDEDKKIKIQIKLNELENEETNDHKIHYKLIHSSLKTICAFANTNGGTLLLGVSDDKKITGLEQDYNSFKTKDRDSFGKYFDSMINEYFGKSFSALNLRKEFLKFNEGDILIVDVSPSKEEIFLLRNENGEPEESLYVRQLSSTEKLTGTELVKFIKRKINQNNE